MGIEERNSVENRNIDVGNWQLGPRCSRVVGFGGERK